MLCCPTNSAPPAGFAELEPAALLPLLLGTEPCCVLPFTDEFDIVYELPEDVAGALLAVALFVLVAAVTVPGGKANGPAMDEPTVGVSKFDEEVTGEFRAEEGTVAGVCW